MLVYLSWSGERSHAVAKALHDWLPNVIQAVKPWMSSKDIDKGSIWFKQNAEELKEAKVGIICLTPENLGSSWISFEAGALWKALDTSRVCPYLLDLGPADVDGPLAHLQMTPSDRDETYKLVNDVNRALGERAMTEERVRKAFDNWWPDLEAELRGIGPQRTPRRPQRPERELLEEVLSTVRQLLKTEQDRTGESTKSLARGALRPEMEAGAIADPFVAMVVAAERPYRELIEKFQVASQRMEDAARAATIPRGGLLGGPRSVPKEDEESQEDELSESAGTEQEGSPKK